MNITAKAVNIYGIVSIVAMSVMLALIWLKLVPDTFTIPFFIFALMLFVVRVVLRIRVCKNGTKRTFRSEESELNRTVTPSGNGHSMRYSSAIKISFLAVAASLAFSLIILPFVLHQEHINFDPDRFGEVALNIFNGNGFSYDNGNVVLERTPMYPYVVAGVFTLAGGFSVTAVQVFQALVHGLTAFVLFLIVARTVNARAAILVQLAFAIHPIIIWYTARIWVETTQTFFLVSVAFMCILLFESPSLKRALLFGLSVGLACLTKAVLLLFPVLISVLLLRRFGSRGIAVGGVIVAGMLLAIAPWTIRNYTVSGEFIPVNTSLGFNLMQGTAIGRTWPSEKKFIMEYWRDGKSLADSILVSRAAPWESVEGDKLLVRSFAESAVNSPLAFVRRFAANVCTFWFLSESSTKSLFIGLLQVPLLLAAIFSYVQMNAERKNLFLPIVLLAGYYILLHSVIVGWGRYSMPVIPLLLILVAPLLDTLSRKN